MNVHCLRRRPAKIGLKIGPTSLLLSLGLCLLLSGAGCQNDTGCARKGTPCGGDPTGTWTLADACRDPVFASPVPVTYTGQPVAQARQPVAPMTSSDWCSSVVINAQGLATFVFPHDTLSVSGTGSQVTYAADSTFQALVNTTGRGSIDLSASCLTRFGVALSCDALAAELTDYAAVQRTRPGRTCTDSPSEPANCLFYDRYDGITCTDNGNGGCACQYDVTFNGTFNGRWSTSGTTLIHFDATKMLPSQADYCVDGARGTLDLWGHERTSLFDESGLRTLNLTKAP